MTSVAIPVKTILEIEITKEEHDQFTTSPNPDFISLCASKYDDAFLRHLLNTHHLKSEDILEKESRYYVQLIFAERSHLLNQFTM